MIVGLSAWGDDPKGPSGQKVQPWRIWASEAFMVFFLGYFIAEFAHFHVGMKYAKAPLIGAGAMAFSVIYGLWKNHAQRS